MQMTCALSQGSALLNAHQLERYRTSKKSYKFLNKRRYIYLELQYFTIEKNCSKLKKKKFFSIDSTNQTFIIYKNSCERNLSDNVTQSYVIKMCVRKTNIGLIWVNKQMYLLKTLSHTHCMELRQLLDSFIIELYCTVNVYGYLYSASHSINQTEVLIN